MQPAMHKREMTKEEFAAHVQQVVTDMFPDWKWEFQSMGDTPPTICCSGVSREVMDAYTEFNVRKFYSTRTLFAVDILDVRTEMGESLNSIIQQALRAVTHRKKLIEGAEILAED